MRRPRSSSDEPRRRGAGWPGRRRLSRTGATPSPADDRDKPAPWFLRRPLLTLLVVIVAVYCRFFSAGFVAFDDDFHVYANPFLNPPTLQSVARLWEHSYKQLYVPLAYTIFAAITRFPEVPAHLVSS